MLPCVGHQCKRVESIDIVPWRHTTSANRSTLPGKASYTCPEAIYIPKSKSPDYHVPHYNIMEKDVDSHQPLNDDVAMVVN